MLTWINLSHARWSTNFIEINDQWNVCYFISSLSVDKTHDVATIVDLITID